MQPTDRATITITTRQAAIMARLIRMFLHFATRTNLAGMMGIELREVEALREMSRHFKPYDPEPQKQTT